MQKVTSYKILATLAVAAVAILAIVGYWFADEKSDPVYLSKIDKLMFDKNNKAPKFVLTLPDPGQNQQSSGNPLISANADIAPIEKDVPLFDIVDAPETLEEIIAQIPNLNQLNDLPATQKLKYVFQDEELVEKENGLLLPKISDDGRKPWSEYGESVNILPNFKKVALVVKGLGFDPLSLDKVAKGLNSEVSISLSPYATNSQEKITSLRLSGHETYIDLLLSSKDFLKSDSGPMSMSITISQDEALQRLKRSLALNAPIGGVVVNDGVADESNQELLTKLFTELKNRGLLVIDATHGDGIDNIKIDGLARRKADIVIDSDFRRETIDKAFKQAEEIAFSKGQVVVVIDPKPIAIIEAYKWIKSFSPQVSYEEAKTMELTKPFALVPISNLVME